MVELNYIKEYKKNNSLELENLTLSLVWGVECNKGWNSLLHELICELNSKKYRLNEKDLIRVVQIKEKFGILEFYCENLNSEGYCLVKIFQEKSQKTCELCGNESKVFWYNGWVRNMCKHCFNEFKIKRPPAENQFVDWDLIS